MVKCSIPRDIYSYNARLASRGAQHDAQGVMVMLDAMLCTQSGTGGQESVGAVEEVGAPPQPMSSLSTGCQHVHAPPKPDSYSFSAVFKSAANAPEDYPPGWLLSTYHAMTAAGVSPNTKVATALLTAALASPGAAEGVLALVPQWRGGGLCDDVLYAQLLLLCGRRGLADRLADVWVALLEVRLLTQTTQHTTTLLHALRKKELSCRKSYLHNNKRCSCATTNGCIGQHIHALP